MLFLNAALIAGLGALLIPIALHLWSQRKPRFTEWAAMQFLVTSIAIRQRKIELEDLLILIVRCLVVALLVLALARPFVPEPASSIPWVVVLPLGLIGIAALAAMAALWQAPIKRFAALAVAALAFLGSWHAFRSERAYQEERLGGKDPQDIVLILDASASMSIVRDGKSNFDRALSEARQLMEQSEPETAFALIQAGMKPVELGNGLTIDRAVTEEALYRAEPTRGAMATLEALSAGLKILESGRHLNQKLIVLTDRQSLGWDTSDQARWNLLANQAKSLPKSPSILLWNLPFPEDYRNLAVTDVQISEPMVKMHYPSNILVTYENTGTTAMTPTGIECHVDDATYTTTAVDQLAPGGSAQASFEHVFTSPGSHALSATLLAEDDVASDNESSFVALVADGMRVLAVDDGPRGGDYFDEGAAYVRLALGSSSTEEDALRFESLYQTVGELDPAFLREQRVNVVWLAAPTQLSKDAQSVLSDFVLAGGGLILSAGIEADAAHYNGWAVQGKKLLPAELLESVSHSRIADRVHPELASLRHGPLRLLSDPEVSDLQTALFSHYWKVAPRGAVRARLNNGASLLLSHDVGEGKVWMFSTSLDSEASSLVTRDCFLPMVQELAAMTAGMSVSDSRATLNVTGETRLNLSLNASPMDAAPSWTAEILSPDQQTFEVELSSGASGLTTSFDWDGSTGIYYLQPTAEQLPVLSGLTDVSERVPFAVRADIAESRRNLLSRADVETMKGHFDVLEVDRIEDTMQVLSGTGFGEELWRLFAVGALGFLIFEMVIARWVANRRRLGANLRAEVAA